jgi:ankyrin repeat protein
MQAGNFTPLMITCRNGDIAAAELLVQAGAKPDIQRNDGITALMIASANGQTDMVSFLLNHGADPAIKSLSGKTALDYAVNSDISTLLENSLNKN